MKKIIIFISSIIIVSLALGIALYSHNNSINNYMDKLNKLPGACATFSYGANTFEELINHSDLIVQGKVINYKPVKEDNLIITFETIEINKVLKGDVSEGDQIIVAVTGGELDGQITNPIENCPIMDMRAPYMLYLVKTDSGNYAVIGGNQGFGKIKGNIIEYTANDKLTENLKKYDKKSLSLKIDNFVAGKPDLSESSEN